MSPFAGSFGTGVAIQVPAFHGLEPRLGLGYSSEGRNGQLGTGWSLSGFSTIERANPGGGTPLFDANDIYLLNGQKMLTCPVGTVSPGCTSGGTHATETESYLRIKYDGPSNTWTVTGRDGSRTTYSPIITVTAGTLRWGQTTVTDTSNNAVTYTWSCPTGDDCYPASASYNGNTVTIYKETRTDKLSFAAVDSVRTTNYRLRSILVKVGSTNVRAYKLTYGTSALTDRSLLTSVQLFGKDVVIDGSGAITGGTSLPAQTFAYTSEPVGKIFQGSSTPPSPPGTTETVVFTSAVGVTITGSGATILKSAGCCSWNAGAASTRALNSGDGYVEWTPGAGIYAAGLTNGDGDATLADIDFAIASWGTGTATAKVYENGVERATTAFAYGSDTFRIEASGGVMVYRKNGSIFYTSTRAITYPLLVDTSVYSTSTTAGPLTLSGTLMDTLFWCGEVLMPADINGDGLTDQVCFSSVGTGFVKVRLANGSGFNQPQTWLSNKKFPYPMLADFNADGRLDVADFNKSSGVVSVGLSTGTSFATPVAWGAGWPACTGNSPDPFSLSTGDFNGDGYSDVSCRKLGYTGAYVAVSTGSSFNYSLWSSTFSCDTDNTGATGAADFDGNGKDDLWCLKSTGGFGVYLSLGTAFAQFSWQTITLGSGSASSPVVADLNGDGRVDLASSQGKVGLSTGKSFSVMGTLDNWCRYQQFMAADVDGDGATELVCSQPVASGVRDIQVRKWKSGVLAPAETWKPNWCLGMLFPGDYNGDGKTDLLCNKDAGTLATAGTADLQADLVQSIGNGLGGTATVNYTPGTTFYGPADNTPVVKQVVTALTTDDGRGGISTRSYGYSGAYYNRPERRFMGFRWMRETQPCLPGESACPYTDTWLLQDLNSAGHPEQIERRDGQGRLFTSQVFEYTTNGATLPRTSLLTAEWNFVGDGTGATCSSWPCSTARRTKAEHSYDAFGNRIQTVSRGDFDVTGDETTTTVGYAPNTTAYIVNRVGRSQIFAGASPSGTKLQETLTYYDGAASWSTPPVNGLPTASLGWLDTENRNVIRHFGYDGYGNQTSVTDETGRNTTTGYDPTYHVFPTSVTNNANETETATWDAVCAVPSQKTDLNGQVTTLQTDALCRQSRIDIPLGNFQQTTYLSLGSPTSQRVRVEAPSASPSDGTGNDYVETYLDGLGRTYRTVKKGPATNQSIKQDTTYNARGATATTTAPYYTGGAIYTTSYEYDAFDRLTRTLLPDGSDVEQSYGLLRQTVVDPNGKPATTRFDVFGRATEKEVSLNGSPVVTTYTYDLLGRMTGIEDALGNTWDYSFDSLGRNYSKDDPDAGTWSYEFDDAGRQEAIVDAKNQRTEFSYDAAGRLLTKTNIGTPNQVTTFTYGEVRAGFYNLGRLTTLTSPADVLKTDYDAQGRVVNQARTLDSVNYSAQRRYDSAGRPLGITYPDGDAVGTPASPLTYDSAGRLRGIPGMVNSITYDAAGRPLVQTNANGTTTTRSYDDDRGFLTGISTTGSAGTIQNLSYTLDPAGLVQQVTSPFVNESWNYGYDDLYRLTQATNTSSPAESQNWTYDEIGRIMYNSRVGNYTYPSIGQPHPHAPQTAGSNSYLYDGNGNMYSGAGRSIAWNKDNLPGTVTIGGSTTSFSYGGHGDRLKKQNGSNTSLYPFDDDYEVTGGAVTKYVAAVGVGVVAKRVGSTTYWLHTERLGSVVAITDSTGTLAQRRSFRPYGQTIASQSSHVESRGWIDQRNDPETGLTYLHARSYDPIVGTFISPDPLGHGGGLNEYAYGLGSPVIGSDRSGLRMIADSGCHATEIGFSNCGGAFPAGSDSTYWFAPNGEIRPATGNWFLDHVNFGYEQAVKERNTITQDITFANGNRQSMTMSPDGTVVIKTAQAERYSFNVPKIAGGPSVLAEFFIQTATTLGNMLQGDNRAFDRQPNPSQSRAFFSIDFASGTGYLQVNPSCNKGGCNSAYPIGDGNAFAFSISGNSVTLIGSLTNSIMNPALSPAIDFGMTFTPSSRGLGFNGTRDAYPSLELTSSAGSQFFTYPETSPLALWGPPLFPEHAFSGVFSDP